jgi:hypothetical protein
MNKFYLNVVLICLFLLLPESLTGQHGTAAKHSEKLHIWALSDIQPQNKEEYYHFELAIDDANKNFPKVDLALLAGDIVQRHNSDHTYKWFLKTRNKSYIKHWFEIAGNHDARNFANYFKYIQKPLYYSVKIGNILILCLSDEINNSPTEISDSTFNWWKEQVINNQDKIIITMTHAYLEQSKLFGYRFHRSNILNSTRFADVLKKYRVDLWLAGHTTAPSSLGYNKARIKELNNTLFINISAIRKEFGIEIESRLIILENNSNKLLIKMRNHEDKEFVKNREIVIKLKTTFKMKSRTPKLIYPKGVIN